MKAIAITLDNGLVKLSLSGAALMVMSNPLGFNMKLEEGVEVGSAVLVDVESIAAPGIGGENGSIGTSMKENYVFNREAMLADEVAHRQHQLDEFVREDVQLPNEERQLLGNLLKQHHDVFCLSDWERGETNLVEKEIHTGNDSPLKQAARRMQFWSEERSCCSAKEYAKGRFYRAFELSMCHSDCFGSEGRNPSLLH